MTESQFIERNKEDWKQLERLLEAPIKDADKMNLLFTKVSSDLAYARTFFPNRSVRLYLNGLTKQVFDSMRTENQSSRLKQLLYFFKEILPYEIYQSRKALMVSFFVFTLATLIGVYSCQQDANFPRLILGDSYIDMTEENIAKGDPMAVYKDENRAGMFFGISTNNIRVSFLAFVLGLLGSVGTVFVLLSNGIMLGAFQYFFYQKGLFLVSFLTIWIHGTIEIASIIIAGGAGIVLGNGLVFPGTYKRTTSLRLSAKRALRIILGLIPMFILAALLESYVTRLTELPTIVKVAIISLSALLILGYFVVYPWYKHAYSNQDQFKYDIEPQIEESFYVDRFVYRNQSDLISVGLMKYRQYVGSILTYLVLPCLLIYLFPLWYEISSNYLDRYSSVLDLNAKSNAVFNIVSFTLVSLVMSLGFLKLIHLLSVELNQVTEGFSSFFKKHYLFLFISTFIYCLPVFFLGHNWSWLYLLCFSPHFLYLLIVDKISKEQFQFQDIKQSISYGFKHWAKYFLYHMITLIIFSLIVFVTTSGLGELVVKFVSWHNIFEYDAANNLYITSLAYLFCILFVIPLNFYFFYFSHASLHCQKTAKDLIESFERFGNNSKIFE